MEARRRSAITTTAGDRELLTFAGCDYLGLAHHDAVVDAALAGIETHGLSAGASRTTTGETHIYRKLEASLATFASVQAATLMPEGYLANIAAMQAMRSMGPRERTIALIDERSHQSQADAAQAAGLSVERYRHLDAHDAAARARSLGLDRVLLATDGVFAADGAVAPLDQLVEQIETPILVDDCHGFGILGPRGRGTCEHFAVASPRVAITTTLAKTFGVYGGCILGSTQLATSVRTHASAFICTTPIPPALAHAVAAALEVHRCELDRVHRLRSNIEAVAQILAKHGLYTQQTVPTPIFAFALGNPEQTHALAHGLLEHNILVPAIGYPGGPAEVYCRLAVSSQHEPEHIDLLGDVLAGLLDH